MLDCTALPHITSHCEDDTPRGQQISSQFLTILSHLDLPNMGIPQFLQVSSAAVPTLFLLPWVRCVAQGRQFGWGHPCVRLIPAATGALGVCQQPE